MSDIVNYGIVGCGMMGQEHLRNLALLPGARVSAIFEPDPEMAREANALAPEAEAMQSLEALLDHRPLDALVIASPNHLHVPQLRTIAARRPLPVLIEKPLHIRPEEASALADLRGVYPAPVWVAMEYRYMPAISRLLQQAGAATGGPLMVAIREHRFPFLPKIGNWNRFNATSGGTLVEKCCHFFDLMRLILQDEPVRVMASAGQMVNHRDERYDGRAPDVWDSAYVIVDFARGGRAMLDLCMYAEGSRWQEELCVTGPKGKIEALVPGPARFWPADLGAPPVAQVVTSPRRPKGPTVEELPVDPALLEAGDHNGATYYQHERFREVVLGRGRPEVTLADGWAAVAMGLAAQKSAEEGRAVRLAPDWQPAPALS